MKAGTDKVSLWSRLFDSPVDSRVYAALRIALAIMLLIHLAVLGPNWIRWFGEEGVLPFAVSRETIDPDTLTIFQWLPGDTRSMWIIYGVILAQVIAFGVGWLTRIQTISIFVWLVSLHHRNNLIWEGEDLLLRITLFLAIFMPLGAIWSVDARRLRTGQQARSMRGTATVWPLRLLQIELSFLYFSATAGKLQGRTWLDGSALHYVFRLEEFSGDRLPLAGLLLEHPGVCQWLTWLTIAVEGLLAFGVWMPSIRRQTVAVGIIFHLMLELTMNLFLFQWLMILILSTHFFTPLSGKKATHA